jgi:D-alanine-D-alanine ligase
MTQATTQRITDAALFGKVAVLMGGWSAEREISLQSGNAVLQALLNKGVNAHGVDVDRRIMQQLQAEDFARVFIALHGRGGEDGVMQGALELLGLPYTGSGVLGSALAMDKLRTKQLWQGAGLPTPGYRKLQADTDFDAVVEELGLPLIVKPVREGSSIGMSKVQQSGQLCQAWETAAALDDVVIAERWIQGTEYTAAILGNECLPLIRLETPHEFYDFDAKYRADSTRYLCPCGLDDKAEHQLRQLALQAFQVTGASGWGRVDMLTDEQGQAWLIEVNTVPGMTDHSLVPMAARAAGIDFDELVWRILETAMGTGEA